MAEEVFTRTQTTVRTSLAALAEDEIEGARTDYLAAFGIYQRNPTEENRLAQKRAYEKLDSLYREYRAARFVLYEHICGRQAQS